MPVLMIIFRALIILSIALFSIMYWFPYFDVYFYSEEISEIRLWDGKGAILEIKKPIEILLFMAGVMIPGLMYFFVAGSRQIFFIMIIFFLVLNFFFGVRVLTPLDIFLSSLISTIDGAILVIAYFTSIDSYFSQGKHA